MATLIDSIPNRGNHIFDPPGNPGNDIDWILVIDDARVDFATPACIRTAK
jgi:hypothetical protein